VAGISLPNFWLAILIILFLIRAFKWFPPLEYATLWANPAVAIQQLALPAAIMGFRAAAGSARMMRSSMLEVLREDYVRTARSKGLVERVVVYGHALRNAVLPVVTVFGMELAFLFGGSVIMETIFNIPGIGSLLINAIHRRDIILVQGIVVTLITVLLLVNLLVDVLYGVIDPRIRFGKRR
jgi:peptide/nickel transport system permease protein